MWYVKDETGKKYYQNSDVRKTQDFAILYNKTNKIPGTKIKISDFNEFFGYYLSRSLWEINYEVFNKKNDFTYTKEKISPFNKKYNKQHTAYVDKKHKLLVKLGKKYHLWSYNEKGRKACGFDF